jgi:ATP-binding cassette subfamily B protein
MASTKRILDLLDTPHKIKDDTKSFILEDFNHDISFENIQFHYQDEKPVFNNLNLSIKKNTLIGIVGQTGAGKTTIIKLLLRFYDPIKGTINIGDHNIKNIKLKNLRENIGYVSQEIFMFDGSINENIAYPEIGDNNDKIMTVAKQSQAHEFIEKLPDGYNTSIGERGQKLSEGQKQRLAIARALYKNPPILIFDEATSSVDNETELLLQKALYEISKDRTTIVIAHRLSTVRNADNIFVLGNNSIIEQGNHSKLLIEKGVYNKLWEIQTGKISVKS